MLKHLRNQLILTGLVCASGVIAYQLLLDDEAKDGLKSLGRTIGESYRFLSDLVDQHIGTIMDDDLIEENRFSIRKAWKDLGY